MPFILFAISLAVIGAILVGAEVLTPWIFGFDASASMSRSTRISILVPCTLIGMLFQVLHVQLKKGRATEVKIFEVLGALTTSREFWLAVVVSPLVLFGAYGALVQVESGLLLAFVSFQNGFFFKALFKGS